MQINRDTIRKDIIELLKEDEEFRYIISGLIGYNSILKGLEEHDKKFNAILEELKVHRDKLEEHDKKFNEMIKELRDLRRVTNEHSKILEEPTCYLLSSLPIFFTFININFLSFLLYSYIERYDLIYYIIDSY